jgi:hypothetical protein
MEPEPQEILESEPLEPTGEVETPVEAAKIEVESAPTEDVTPEKSGAPVTDEMPDKVQKRIDEVIWQKHEAQRERDYWKMQAEARLRAEQEAPNPQPPAPFTAPVPRQEDFDTYEAYEEAVFDYRYQKRSLVEQSAREKQSREQAEKAQKDQLSEWIGKGEDKYQDFRQVALKEPREGGPEITVFMAITWGKIRKKLPGSPECHL